MPGQELRRFTLFLCCDSLTGETSSSLDLDRKASISGGWPFVKLRRRIPRTHEIRDDKNFAKISLVEATFGEENGVVNDILALWMVALVFGGVPKDPWRSQRGRYVGRCVGRYVGRYVGRLGGGRKQRRKKEKRPSTGFEPAAVTIATSAVTISTRLRQVLSRFLQVSQKIAIGHLRFLNFSSRLRKRTPRCNLWAKLN